MTTRTIVEPTLEPVTLAEAKLRKPNELQSRTNVTVEIEGEDKPALIAEWLGLVYLA